MTKIQKSNAKEVMSLGQIIFCAMSAFVLVLTFIESQTVIEAMSQGLRVCTEALIPSLFPFMVLSELLMDSGAPELLCRVFGKAFERVFGIRREGAAAFLLGITLGFPIGAKSALSLYQSGRISRSELEHLMCFCNGPSPAFLISAVGVSLFGSQRLGFLFYGADILAATVIGIASRVFFDHKGDIPAAIAATNEKKRQKSPGAIRSLCSAVRSSALSMLYICAFITFFSVLIGVISSYMQALGAPKILLSLTLGFFEMTSGVTAASSLTPGAALLCVAAIIGWSGLSVHFQLVSLCDESELSFFSYFAAKAMRSALSVVIIFLWSMLFGDIAPLFESSSPSFIHTYAPHPLHIFTLSVFCAAVIVIIKGKRDQLRGQGRIKNHICSKKENY